MEHSLPPGPKLSIEEQTFLWFSTTYSFLDRCARDHGDSFTIEFKGFGKHVFFSEPTAVQEIYRGDPAIFRAGAGNPFLRPMLHTYSLLTMDGAPYTRHRKMILPAFQPQRVTELATLMREETEISLSKWEVGKPFSALRAFRELALSIVLRTLFGPVVSERARQIKALLVQLLDDLILTPSEKAPTAEGALAVREWEKFNRSVEELDTLVYAEIASAREKPADGTMLSLLIAAKDEAGIGFSDTELRDELVTLVVAGHETTATSLAWAIYWILHKAEVSQKLLHEIESQPKTPDRWATLPYLEAAIKESLRMNPVIPFVSWLLEEPVTIAGFKLPAGIHVAPCSYLTHRRPDLYPDPTVFRPERFLERKYTPYEFHPFAGGVRRCIGMYFAMLEMKIVIGTIFEKLTLRLDQTAPKMHAVRRSVVVAPAGGTRVVVMG